MWTSTSINYHFREVLPTFSALILNLFTEDLSVTEENVNLFSKQTSRDFFAHYSTKCLQIVFVDENSDGLQLYINQKFP